MFRRTNFTKHSPELLVLVLAKGQIKGQQDTEQMLANADAGGSAAPPKKAVDP
jgi:hypothetical protein